MTVRNRFKRLQESGALSIWQVIVNPTLFGFRILEVLIDVEPESAKGDMIRKLKLVHGIFVIVNFYGKAIKLILGYDSEEMRSRTIELISRITNAENLTIFHIQFPLSETKFLTQNDKAIISALSSNARKSSLQVAEELGLSSKTVRNSIAKLRREKTLFNLPNTNLGDISNLIPIHLTYAYSNREAKPPVDEAMCSHFDSSYLWGEFTDPDRGYLILSAQKMTDVGLSLAWAKDQPGVTGARADIFHEVIRLSDKLKELRRTVSPQLK